METTSPQQLREIQLCLLEILKAVTKVCDEHGLRYSLYAGTLIGAVRHKGFVPWDDDLDIAMPRKDYNIFLEHANEWLPEHYRLLDGRKVAEYPYEFARVRDERTTYLLRRRFEFLSGVPIDIFPIDGMIADGVKRKWHYFRFRRYMQLLYWSRISPYKPGGSKAREWFLRLAHKLIDSRRIQNALFRIEQEYALDDPAIPLAADHNDKPFAGVWPKSVIENLKEYEFEGCKFFGPADPHPYLSTRYGDYMTPPPVEQRPKPNFRILDLHKSYKDANWKP